MGCQRKECLPPPYVCLYLLKYTFQITLHIFRTAQRRGRLDIGISLVAYDKLFIKSGTVYDAAPSQNVLSQRGTNTA